MPLSSVQASVGGDVCAAVCERAAALQCLLPTACRRDCLTTRDALSACVRSIDAFLTCQLGQPLEHLECQGEGMPTVKEPHCAAERAAIATCIEQVGSSE